MGGIEPSLFFYFFFENIWQFQIFAVSLWYENETIHHQVILHRRRSRYVESFGSRKKEKKVKKNFGSIKIIPNFVRHNHTIKTTTMEYAYLEPSTLVEKLVELVLPSHTTEDLAKRAFAFRERNWTSQGTYAYVKSSSFSKVQQDEMKDLLKSVRFENYDDVYFEYENLLRQEILTEWDLTEELEGVEEDSDEYYDLIHECIGNTTEINCPFFHFILACIELMEEYASNVFHDEYTQEGVNEMVEEMGLVDDYGFIYQGEDDETYVEYTIDFNYDKMENVIYDSENQEITLDELKEKLEKLKISFVD